MLEPQWLSFWTSALAKGSAERCRTKATHPWRFAMGADRSADFANVTMYQGLRSLRGPASSLLHAEIVLHREDAGDAVGLNIRNVLVSFVGDDPFKSHVAILHDDMDGRH